MESFIILSIGIFCGIFIPFYFQVLLFVTAIFSIIFFEKKNLIEGIGSLFFFTITILFSIGMLIGDAFFYIHQNYIKENFIEKNKVLSNLPSITCFNGTDKFILTEYSFEENNIINIKSGQVFLKQNCSFN